MGPDGLLAGTLKGAAALPLDRVADAAWALLPAAESAEAARLFGLTEDRLDRALPAPVDRASGSRVLAHRPGPSRRPERCGPISPDPTARLHAQVQDLLEQPLERSQVEPAGGRDPLEVGCLPSGQHAERHLLMNGPESRREE